MNNTIQKKINKETLINDLKKLGISSGDVLYIRGDMGQIGDPREIEGLLKNIFIEALLEVVGEDGTVVTSSYSKIKPFWNLKKTDIYTLKTPSYTGALPRLFLKYKDHVRSRHPSNSCVAIGKLAHAILDSHDEMALAYSPMSKLIEFNAKIISFGCVENNPGFPTTHYVEEVLGLTKKTLLKGVFQIYYFDKIGNKKKFKRIDPGGCAFRVYKFYEEYAKQNVWTIGAIGRAITIKANLKDSFDLEYELIKKNPGLISCDNSNCIFCNLLSPRKKNTILKFCIYKSWIMGFKMLDCIIRKKNWRTVFMGRADYQIDKDPLFSEIIEEIHNRYGANQRNCK